MNTITSEIDVGSRSPTSKWNGDADDVDELASLPRTMAGAVYVHREEQKRK